MGWKVKAFDSVDEAQKFMAEQKALGSGQEPQKTIGKFEVGQTLYRVNPTFNNLQHGENWGWDATMYNYSVDTGSQVNHAWHHTECFGSAIEAIQAYEDKLNGEIQNLKTRLMEFKLKTTH